MEDKNLENIKSILKSLDSVEKLEKLEIVYSAFKIVTKDVLNDYGVVMFDVLDVIFGDKKTPNELKKYYLKHKFLGIFNDRNYLKQAICDDEIFMLSDTFENEVMRTQFTLEEIEEIKEKYGTDLKDFELIEVKNENN